MHIGIIMQGERVLVTGGAGFIGSNLAEALAEGSDVVIFDDLSTGKLVNIRNLQKNNNVQFIKGSITDDRLLHKCFSDIDYVFHQAALPSVPRSIKDPKGSNEVNVTGTLNVLIAARDCNVKKVVFASSSSVYGDTPSLPKREDMPVDGRQNRASGGRTHICPAGHTWICGKAEELGYHSKVITAGRAVNDYMPLHVFEQVEVEWLGFTYRGIGAGNRA
jgi:nucleoside-diphosphate-sugar epimerase